MTDCKLRTIPALRVEGFTFDLQRFATDTWDGTASSVPAAVNNVITITTAEQFAALAKNVNDEDNSNNYSGVTIKLGADLDLNGDNYSWTPIGTEYNPFSGTFDGDGHTISNLKINSDKSGVGLFSIIDGTIMNVTLNNVDVTGWDHVGGLVGLNVGSVENCTVTNATVSGTDLVGGLVGRNYNGTVSGNTVSGTVSGNENVGGLVGQNDGGTVSGNTVSGTVSGNDNSNRVGGLVGGNGGNVTDNTVSGTVSGNRNVGGLVGWNEATVTGNTVISTVSSSDWGGGLVGENYKGTVSGNKFYSNKGDVGSNDDGNAENNTKLYKLTLPSGVEATATGTGNKVVADNGNYYAAGTVTISATTANAIIRSTNSSYTNNDDGTVSVTPTADTSISSSDIAFYYAVSIPNCVQSVSGTSYGGNYSDYYTGTVTLAAKTGYNLSQTSLTVTENTTISATFDTANHYVLANNTSTLATADNTTAYPDLIQVYALNLPEGVTASGDSVVTIEGTTYATGDVTLSAADGYSLQNVKVDGKELTDNFTFTVDADATITADSVKFGNGGKSVVVGGTTGDFSAESGVYSITAAKENSTLTGNNNNNNVVIAGGGENILTGGGGNDTYQFSKGGGIVTDFGIGSTKDSTGKTLSAPLGSDVIKLDGEVSGVYFDRDASSKKSATFTAVITYGTGDDTQIIVLQNINKKPTKYSSDASKVVYQTNDAAAATLKIWDTSGSKQAVLSASKLKKLFHDDSELDTLGDLVRAKITYLGDIADGKTPTTNPFEQTTTITPNGNDNG